MKNKFLNVFTYIKSVIKEWYLFLGFIPSILSYISIYLPDEYYFKFPVQYTIALVFVVFLVATYRVWYKAQRKDKKPNIIIDYDLSVFNLCYLEIKNIGNEYARDIQTIFHPDIEFYNKQRINEQRFCKKLFQLAPGKKIRFFFGAFTDKKILQEFSILISYYDFEHKEKFITEQAIDPRTFLGSSPQHKESQVVRELKEITKNIKILSENTKKVPEILKAGISIRNYDISGFSENELFSMLKNIYQNGNEEDMWLDPFFYDLKQIVRCLRNKLLVKEKLNPKEEQLLEKLNFLHKYRAYIGSSNDFKEKLGELFKD